MPNEISTLLAFDGFHEQIFRADEQVPGRQGRSLKKCSAQRDAGREGLNSTLRAALLTCPGRPLGWGFFVFFLMPQFTAGIGEGQQPQPDPR